MKSVSFDTMLRALVYPLLILAVTIIAADAIKDLARSGAYTEQAKLESIKWQAADIKAFLQLQRGQKSSHSLPKLRGINEGKAI